MILDLGMILHKCVRIFVREKECVWVYNMFTVQECVRNCLLDLFFRNILKQYICLFLKF